MLVRVGKDAYSTALRQPDAAPLDITGRLMSSWVMVNASALQAQDDLRAWVEKGMILAQILLPK